ncbi:MAG: hypothetical protein TR69_WS6001000729 [candidate division WS6 bacterium OLB20]|uniref:Uncharacterized protein n=1 Tax=candidate division WS6 bacterium OLB20 TaxID=1617426 RepID=A0A136LYJ5_9BACT|nr:MAG: hypothetical protein TR69_WS6001000729 [candidate division WS6 bacterium OLB20]
MSKDFSPNGMDLWHQIDEYESGLPDPLEGCWPRLRRKNEMPVFPERLPDPELAAQLNSMREVCQQLIIGGTWGSGKNIWSERNRKDERPVLLGSLLGYDSETRALMETLGHALKVCDGLPVMSSSDSYAEGDGRLLLHRENEVIRYMPDETVMAMFRSFAGGKPFSSDLLIGFERRGAGKHRAPYMRPGSGICSVMLRDHLQPEAGMTGVFMLPIC